jgi:acetolactate synthase-1/2/3 large subunit
MRPEAVLVALSDEVPDDTVLTADTGYASAWAGGILELRSAGRNFLRADGSLSWAFPGALGAQLAVPDQQVVCIIGDGGFGYHVGEIETALRLNLPITVVILNNQTLAFEAHVQTLLYDHFVPEVDDFLDVDYAAVARSFGADGHRVRNVSEFRSALRAGLERRKIPIIDAFLEREAIAPVTRYDKVRTREL